MPDEFGMPNKTYRRKDIPDQTDTYNPNLEKSREIHNGEA